MRRSGVIAFVVLAVLLGVLVVEQLELRHADQGLATTSDQIATTSREVTEATTLLQVSRSQRDGVQSSLAQATTSLGQERARFSQTEIGLYAAGVNVGALNRCLGGVEEALNQLAVHEARGALRSLYTVSASCAKTAAAP